MKNASLLDKGLISTNPCLKDEAAIQNFSFKVSRMPGKMETPSHKRGDPLSIVSFRGQRKIVNGSGSGRRNELSPGTVEA